MDIFDNYKEDRVPHGLLYILARIGLFITVNLLAIVCSILVCSGISTVLGIVFEDNSFVVLEAVPFLNSPTVTSFVGFLIMLGVMLRLFWDDGKRHMAYGRFSMPVAAGAVLFMFVVYIIPSIFLEDAKDSLAVGIKSFYKPSLWLSETVGGSIEVPVVISAGLVAVLCLIIYKVSGDFYLKKHPEIYSDEISDSGNNEC